MDVVQPKQAGSGEYRSTRGLTIAVLGLLGTHALVSLAGALVLQQILASRPVTRSSPLFLFLRVHDVLRPVLFVACGVCFLVWLHRAWSNLPSLGSGSAARPKGLIVGWFIPLLNFVHGYRVTRELYLESQRPAVLPDGGVLPTNAAIVGWWWGLWVACNLIERFYSNIARAGEDAFLWYYATTTLDIAAALLCATVVHRVDKRQRDQRDDLARRASVPGPSADSLR